PPLWSFGIWYLIHLLLCIVVYLFFPGYRKVIIDGIGCRSSSSPSSIPYASLWADIFNTFSSDRTVQHKLVPL
ncbi:hypothetical protein NEOLEDRAFT_1080855, partial [Neolentinus lepideus HHB14362 ss-1]